MHPENGKIVCTARALIIDEGELLVFRLTKAPDWYSLPGGKIDFGESFAEAIKRELIEETGIEPVVGRLLVMREMILPDRHRVEMFFEIKNSADYRNIDLTKTTHGLEEIADVAFVDVTKTDKKILPEFLKKLVPKIVSVGIDNFQFMTERGE